MRNRNVYTSEQLQKLSAAHKVICNMRGLDPHGIDGRELAARLLDSCSGSESDEEMLKHFAH